MQQKIMSHLIEAIKQERQRIEEPKNRSRYFIFSKVNERDDRDGYSVTFENAPNRVLRDAMWSARQGTSSLFRVGDIFISGVMEITSEGICVFFSVDEIDRLNIDIAALKRMTDIGIDYIMDNRELTEQLLAFLESKVHFENQFLEPLTQYTNAISMKSIGSLIACSNLNTSQRHGIEKALSQKVTFFWGPPGTGKTKTMSALAASLIKNKKRVLLTSLSNMALDQLFLKTLDLLEHAADRTSIARLGSTMDEKCQGFSRNAFKRSVFEAKRAGLRWSEHVKYASLVAGNFAMLTFPRAANPGQFDYVIADEVSMASIPSLLAASFFATTGIVVGGDPYQLPPIYPEDAEEPNEWFRANVFEKAGIEQPDDPRAAFLDTQYRMQHEIADLVSEMFYKDVGGLKTGLDALAPIGGFDGRVVFINSPGVVETVGADYLDAEEHRRFNEVHAESAIKAVCVALRQGVKSYDIGIIAPYNAQVVKILQKLRQFSRQNALDIDGLKVSTVHSFEYFNKKEIEIFKRLLKHARLQRESIE
jgi:superfamily I DNA and/or RNA helicase